MNIWYLIYLHSCHTNSLVVHTAHSSLKFLIHSGCRNLPCLIFCFSRKHKSYVSRCIDGRREFIYIPWTRPQHTHAAAVQAGLTSVKMKHNATTPAETQFLPSDFILFIKSPKSCLHHRRSYLGYDLMPASASKQAFHKQVP